MSAESDIQGPVLTFLSALGFSGYAVFLGSILVSHAFSRAELLGVRSSLAFRALAILAIVVVLQLSKKRMADWINRHLTSPWLYSVTFALSAPLFLVCLLGRATSGSLSMASVLAEALAWALAGASLGLSLILWANLWSLLFARHRKRVVYCAVCSSLLVASAAVFLMLEFPAATTSRTQSILVVACCFALSCAANYVGIKCIGPFETIDYETSIRHAGDYARKWLRTCSVGFFAGSFGVFSETALAPHTDATLLLVGGLMASSALLLISAAIRAIPGLAGVEKGGFLANGLLFIAVMLFGTTHYAWLALLIYATVVLQFTSTICGVCLSACRKMISPTVWCARSIRYVFIGMLAGFAVQFTALLIGVSAAGRMAIAASMGLAVILANFLMFTYSYGEWDELFAYENDLELTTDAEAHEEVRSMDRWRRRCDTIAANADLTRRETEVFRLLGRGRNVNYIANLLFISPYTVKSHVYNIYKKLDVSSHQELLDRIEENGATADA